MRKSYSSLFNNSIAPQFDMGNMYQFGQPEPPPIGNNMGNFSLKPRTSLQDDAKDLSSNGTSEPSFSATKALLDYIKNTPTREANQLGTGGRIAASLAGAAAGWKDPVEGVKLATQMTEQPYRNALVEHGSKLPGLELAANLESETYGRDIAYKKMLSDHLYNQGRVGNESRDLDIKEGQLEEEIRNNKADYDLNKNRYQQEGWKEFTDDKGNMWMVNPQLPEGQNKKQIGTSIRNREVGALESNAASNRISAGASVTSANASASNASTNAARLRDVEIPGSKSNIAKDDETIAKSQQIDPQEQLYAQALASREVIAENPSWARYLNEDGSVNYNDVNWFGDSRETEDFKKFTEAVKSKLDTDSKLPILDRKYKRPIKLGRSLTVPQ